MLAFLERFLLTYTELLQPHSIHIHISSFYSYLRVFFFNMKVTPPADTWEWSASSGKLWECLYFYNSNKSQSDRTRIFHHSWHSIIDRLCVLNIKIGNLCCIRSPWLHQKMLQQQKKLRNEIDYYKYLNWSYGTTWRCALCSVRYIQLIKV